MYSAQMNPHQVKSYHTVHDRKPGWKVGLAREGWEQGWVGTGGAQEQGWVGARLAEVMVTTQCSTPSVTVLTIPLYYTPDFITHKQSTPKISELQAKLAIEPSVYLQDI